MKQGQCVDMTQARSLKPRYRVQHPDWLQEVNKLQMHCKLETFSDFGCVEASKNSEYQHGHNGDVPKDLNNCLALASQEGTIGSPTNGFFSAKFVCARLESPEQLCTKVIKHTTWSIDSTYLAPHYSVHTATYTGSLAMSAQASIAIERRFDPGRESKGVWMLHPWSQSLQCFLCYPKKEHDYRKIECRGGIAFPANCGPEPHPPTPHFTTTTTTTKVSTIHSTTTATTTTTRSKEPVPDHSDSSSDSSSDDDDLPRLDFELQQKKSWHTPVKFPHPFIDGKEACADAEWEKRGQIGRDYVKIQKVHICDKKDRKDSQWIGLPPLEVRTLQETHDITTTMLHTEIKVHHDQL